MAISTLISKGGEQTESIQEATAKTLAETRMKDSSQNALILLIKAEDPTATGKVRFYLTTKKHIETSNTLEFVGYEITKTQLKALNIASIEEYVKEGKSEIVSLWLPWTKIISIQNIKYKQKKV
jgi:hypothetical protein